VSLLSLSRFKIELHFRWNNTGLDEADEVAKCIVYKVETRSLGSSVWSISKGVRFFFLTKSALLAHIFCHWCWSVSFSLSWAVFSTSQLWYAMDEICKAISLSVLHRSHDLESLTIILVCPSLLQTLQLVISEVRHGRTQMLTTSSTRKTWFRIGKLPNFWFVSFNSSCSVTYKVEIVLSGSESLDGSKDYRVVESESIGVFNTWVLFFLPSRYVNLAFQSWLSWNKSDSGRTQVTKVRNPFSINHLSNFGSLSVLSPLVPLLVLCCWERS